jgi:hypothetical protein
VPWKTWREEREADQAPGKWSRSDLWEGCSVLVMIPMFIIGGIVGVLAFTLGIDALAGWIISLIEPLMGPPALAVIGVALIVVAAWAVFRLATGHAPPGTRGRDLIIAVMVMIGVGVSGLALLLAAFAPPAAQQPGF